MNFNNYSKIFDFKSIKETYKSIYGHYPPSLKAVEKAHEQYKRAQKEANRIMAPYRAKKKEYENFDNICRFHGVVK